MILKRSLIKCYNVSHCTNKRIIMSDTNMATIKLKQLWDKYCLYASISQLIFSITIMLGVIMLSVREDDISLLYMHWTLIFLTTMLALGTKYSPLVIINVHIPLAAAQLFFAYFTLGFILHGSIGESGLIYLWPLLAFFPILPG